MNELIEKIEALPSKGVIGSLPYKSESIDHLCTISDLKSLAAALTLANKKLAILQASNDHYAEHNWWLKGDDPSDPFKESQEEIIYIYGGNGYDFARKAQEQIARLEGENG